MPLQIRLIRFICCEFAFNCLNRYNSQWNCLCPFPCLPCIPPFSVVQTAIIANEKYYLQTSPLVTPAQAGIRCLCFCLYLRLAAWGWFAFAVFSFFQLFSVFFSDSKKQYSPLSYLRHPAFIRFYLRFKWLLLLLLLPSLESWALSLEPAFHLLTVNIS